MNQKNNFYSIPVTQTKNHIKNQDEVQGLVDMISSSPENYEHLQIFLNRERTCESLQDFEFLMVTPTVLGKVKLMDLVVEDNSVILEILDCSTQKVGNIRLNIKDSNPKAFFICWKDIKKMVMDENAIIYNSNELLEFEF